METIPYVFMGALMLNSPSMPYLILIGLFMYWKANRIFRRQDNIRERLIYFSAMIIYGIEFMFLTIHGPIRGAPVVIEVSH